MRSEKGPLVDVPLAAVKSALAGRSLLSVARLTGIDRRQLRRLQQGELRRTHSATLARLETHCRLPAGSLRNSTVPGEQHAATDVAETRAAMLMPRLRTQWALERNDAALDVVAVLERLFCLQTWTSALAPGGTAIIRARNADAGFRVSQRSAQRELGRSVRFAHALGQVLEEVLCPSGGSGVSRPTREATAHLVTGILQVLDAAAAEGHARLAPESRTATRRVVADVKQRLLKSRKAPRRARG